jgi:hypothetical protein
MALIVGVSSYKTRTIKVPSSDSMLNNTEFDKL